MKLFKQLAVALRAVRIVFAVRTAALVAEAAPHCLMIAAELVRGFVSFEITAPRFRRMPIILIVEQLLLLFSAHRNTHPFDAVGKPTQTRRSLNARMNLLVVLVFYARLYVRKPNLPEAVPAELPNE